MTHPIEHETARDLAALAAGGDLDPGDQVALQQHLAVCPDCAAEAGELEQALATLALLEPTAPHTPLVSATAGGLTRPWRWLGIGLLLAVVGVGLVSWRLDPGDLATEPLPVSDEGVLYQVVMAPGDFEPRRRRSGRLPSPQSVVSARAIPALWAAASEAVASRAGRVTTVVRSELTATTPAPIAADGEVRGRTLLTAEGRRLLPSPRLVLQPDDSWLLCEVP